MAENFAKLGVLVPEVLLPRPELNTKQWPVVACDQYTSQPDYWAEVADIVGQAPSTLNLIFPEVFLGKGNEAERITGIHQKMRAYLNDKTLQRQVPGFIYVERRTVHGNLRRGLVMAVDLECYNYNPGSQTLIRATEGTVLDRIPPRVRIRDGAPIELPHIMLLIDDPEGRVIEPLAKQAVNLPKLYDVDLMMDGGHVTGYQVTDPAVLASVAAGLAQLADPEVFNQKYDLQDQAVLLFAVGDGNHSLATAKAVWEKLKAQTVDKTELEHHPARYALVELVNVHDPGLQFEPIHRVLFNLPLELLVQEMQQYYAKNGIAFAWETDTQAQLQLSQLQQQYPDAHLVEFVCEKGRGQAIVCQPVHNLTVGTLQAFIDDLMSEHPQVEVDYIHGAEVVEELGKQPGNVGFLLPTLPKSELFKTVIVDGVLPRKTFSMGEAEEKRFYMECRQISFSY